VVRRLTSVAAAAGSLVATVANLGCCGVALVGPSPALGGLAALLAPIAAPWGYEALYASLAVTLVPLGIDAWRRGPAFPLAIAAAGSAALLLAFHEAWTAQAFAGLVVGGSLALASGVAANLLLQRGASQRGTSRRRLSARDLTCAT
jgi:hypothetical protein